MTPKEIRIEDYNYPLPDERIAKYPLAKRDESKLLLYKDGNVSESVFKRITDYLPNDALMVFNNTRVIQARLLFNKETGARIEIFCLEPAEPRDYALIFQTTSRCRWTCLVGNLKKWKSGSLTKELLLLTLRAEKLESKGDSHLIEFTWDDDRVTFAELLDAAGILPIPPYLHRETEQSDLSTYQTVYSKIKGSVAAPTAGLHFTPEVLADIDAHGIGREEVTLHVGAGTFKPVKSETIAGHEMHTEFIAVGRSSIERLRANLGKIIAVGTTSVRTLESLYYIGVLIENNPDATSEELVVGQWMPYDEANNRLPVSEALGNILDYLDRRGAIVTNFHQPRSTLLLLISAFVKGDWRRIYDYALGHDFRFLSYGDSSLLL